MDSTVVYWVFFFFTYVCFLILSLRFKIYIIYTLGVKIYDLDSKQIPTPGNQMTRHRKGNSKQKYALAIMT